MLAFQAICLTDCQHTGENPLSEEQREFSIIRDIFCGKSDSACGARQQGAPFPHGTAHLLLQLTELGGQGLQAHAGLLELLMRCCYQVAVPVGRLAGIVKLANTERQIR